MNAAVTRRTGYNGVLAVVRVDLVPLLALFRLRTEEDDS